MSKVKVVYTATVTISGYLDTATEDVRNLVSLPVVDNVLTSILKDSIEGTISVSSSKRVLKKV